MKEIFLTKSIENEHTSYIDDVVTQIKSVESGKPLRMLITSYGGNTDQGDRIFRAIREHDGDTEAMVIGIAASMAASILPAFDKVYLDPDSELMFHKARVIDSNNEVVPETDLETDTVARLKRFNAKTYSRLVETGADEKFSNKVFLSDSTEDEFLTAKEAEKLGIGKIKDIPKSEAMSIAASLDFSNQIKKELKMFKKKKVTQVATLKDGRQVAFKSSKNEIRKGDTLELIGSEEVLKGDIFLSNTLKAVINEAGEVSDIEEVEEPENEANEDQIAEMAQRIADLEAAVGAIQETMGEGEADEAEAEAKAEAKAKEDEEEKEAIKDLAEKTIAAAEKISTVAKLDKIEDKGEKINSGLTAEQSRISQMHSIAKGFDLNKKTEK